MFSRFSVGYQNLPSGSNTTAGPCELIAVASASKATFRLTTIAALAGLFLLSLCGCDPPPSVSDSAESASSRGIEAAEIELGKLETQKLPNTIPADTATPNRSAAVTEFLRLFDPISEKGFVPTMRKGSTGVGYTLETLLEIEENNSPGGDFMGMEIKTFRDADIGLDDAEKMNLFLKEPKWIDGLKSAERVARYGYVDENGRTALYSTVTIEQNSHGFSFQIQNDRSRVWLNYDSQHVAFWTREILEKRLTEKHSETVFVSARSRGSGRKERFHYYGVTWCREASVDAFMDMISEGDVMLELRMHLKESGSTRNHGSAFRIKQNRIRDLFQHATQVRPK